MFERQMKNQENICNRYDITQGFMSTAYGFWPIREEMSTSTKKGIKRVHREPETASGTLLLTVTHQCEKNKWPCINLEETETSHLPPRRDRDLSADTCPIVAAHHPFLLPVGTPLPFLDLTVRAGVRLTDVWPMDAVS